MSHFDPGKQMQLLKEKFITSALARCNIPRETGEQVWELMAAFCRLWVPKAHAASYALLAWRSALVQNPLPGRIHGRRAGQLGGYYPQRVYLTEAPPHGAGRQAAARQTIPA